MKPRAEVAQRPKAQAWKACGAKAPREFKSPPRRFTISLNPKWIICDAGYGKTKNQILMRHYPGRVWSAFTNSGSNIPIWNTINEINGLPLPEDDWQYHVSVNHTAMCENTEAIINRRNLGIYYFPEQAARTDVFIFEISQADAEAGYNQNVMTRAPRFARRRFA